MKEQDKRRNRFRLFSKSKSPSEHVISDESNAEPPQSIQNVHNDPLVIFWPKDLLAVDFPRARIMTFGYNTGITQNYRAVNQGNLFSHAKNLLYDVEAKRRRAPSRDLIFIAHSLGGILVKEVLRRSEIDPDPRILKIFQSTNWDLLFRHASRRK